MDYLLDTSAIYAAYDARDSDHRRARGFLRSGKPRLHTTSAIVQEAYTLFRRRAGYRYAMDWVRATRSSPAVTIHFQSPEDDAGTWEVLQRYSGVPLSYADASLIALGVRLGIRSAFAFDEDFQQAGLALVP